MANVQSPSTHFDSLKALILSSLDKYEAGLKREGLPKPNLVDSHPLDDPNIHLPSQELFDVQNQLVGALEAMASIVEPALTQLHMKFAPSQAVGAAMDVFINAQIADTLENAGPSGISSSALAAKTKIEEKKLVHILRFLTTRFVVREISPKVFAGTRISRYLVKGNLARSWMLLQSYLGIPASSQFRNAVLDPAHSHSYDLEDCAVGLYYDFKGHGYKYMFEWLADQKEGLVSEFGQAMASLSHIGNPAFLSDFPWASFNGRKVVDVGGGVGSFLLSILEANPGLKGVVQDRPETVELGRKHYAEHLPQALKDNRVEFEAVDFFKEQPRSGDEYVYMMRYVLHDYPDNVVIDMLKIIGAKMTKGARLLLVDTLLPSTLESSGGNELYPLTEATSRVDRYGYDMDIVMLHMFNACERTVPDFEYVIKEAGLEVVKVHQPRTMWGIIEVKKKD